MRRRAAPRRKGRLDPPPADIILKPYPHTLVCPECGLTRNLPDGWQGRLGVSELMCTADNVAMEEV